MIGREPFEPLLQRLSVGHRLVKRHLGFAVQLAGRPIDALVELAHPFDRGLENHALGDVVHRNQERRNTVGMVEKGGTMKQDLSVEFAGDQAGFEGRATARDNSS